MLVLTWVMVTVAPATTALLVSVTVPSKVPVTAWPRTRCVAAIGPRAIARIIVNLPRRFANSFIIDSPSLKLLAEFGLGFPLQGLLGGTRAKCFAKVKDVRNTFSWTCQQFLGLRLRVRDEVVGSLNTPDGSRGIVQIRPT